MQRRNIFPRQIGSMADRLHDTNCDETQKLRSPLATAPSTEEAGNRDSDADVLTSNGSAGPTPRVKPVAPAYTPR